MTSFTITLLWVDPTLPKPLYRTCGTVSAGTFYRLWLSPVWFGSLDHE